jgi:cell division septation protein DedD
MAGKLLKSRTYLRGSIAVLSVLALAACDENGEFNFGGDAAETADTAPAAVAAASGAGVQLEQRDVEAPEIFQVSEQGLWDGRPSLGGVWVAHPDVSDPERVIIRNAANDKFVIGALFRRERDNPGPALQISSDTAEALGVLAGSPTTLSVTALRREDAVVAAPVATAVSDFDAPNEVTASALDTLAGAAAAIDAADQEVTTAAITPAPTPAAPAPTASSLAKPYIQIGIFSVEANATRNATRLRADGLSTNVLAQESQGRPFWRVIVGPAPTSGDRAAILDKVKALGFSDAYFVTN